MAAAGQQPDHQRVGDTMMGMHWRESVERRLQQALEQAVPLAPAPAPPAPAPAA
eukprot:SAG22_NODE_21393_length_257_cov_0.968354_1_plen_53_part_01